ncbi:efflux RND transporter permease subunit [Roseospira marina]|uniref:Efflux RND transporter permease subunit n=1 Tax=Roseospira marina TaxID=140057 RepID=A0A5M6ICJ9_9PROT|nr:efflux RND transporter permease subunit [Roseospira marina]KAA5606000.1 efflux RND transporter permease subunit [Roseospira marina]MBB4313147.1 multidrug efflux pump subunit AcrB [Roseospira marina]MBB5086112.1 multidrug efflux pump subunit AcrB [Roseospira marina]
MIAFFARHPTAANLLMIGILVLGLAALPSLQRETFPKLSLDEVQVTVVYLGATADEVETAICQRLEEAVSGINDLKERRCEAVEGVGTLTAEMLDDGDIRRFEDDIKTEVDAIDSFPEDTEDPVVRTLGRSDFVASVAITGEMPATDLKAYAEELKNRLNAAGLGQVEINGFSDRQIRIEVAMETLRRFGLSLSDFATLIERQSQDRPSGRVETRDGDVIVRFADERRSAAAFRDLVIVASTTGGELRLGDIARVTDLFERAEEKVLFNGTRAALLDITKTRAQDTLVVMDRLNAFLDEERARAPAGVALTVTRDSASIVRDRLTMLLDNGVQGLVLVFLTMFLFFSLRFSFWVAMGLPVSFMGGLFLMGAFGLTINMITMVALLIAVGLLMDDAIVISENIARHLKRGKAPYDAAIDGAREVFPGVVSSFVTTICIFGALAFLAGTLGQILRALPVVLLLVLAVSLIEAFIILPHHLAHALEKHTEKDPASWRRRFESGFDWVRERLMGRLVDVAVSWRYLAFGLLMLAFLSTVALVAGGFVKFRAFPHIDGNTIQAEILMPQGTPLAETEAAVAHVTAALDSLGRRLSEDLPADAAARDPDAAATIGGPLVRNVVTLYSVNTTAAESGAHVATVSADLIDSDQRPGLPSKAVAAAWRAEAGVIPDAISLRFAERQLGPAGRAVEIRLRGRDTDSLKAAALDLRRWLEGYAGVYDVMDDMRPGKPEVSLSLRDGASALGVRADTVARQIAAAFQGVTVDELQIGDEAVEIDVRLLAEDRDSLADLDRFMVTTEDGASIPLTNVATLEGTRGWARIARVDGSRTITVIGDVDDSIANAQQIVAHTKAVFLPQLLERHPDVRPDFEGQAKEMAETMMSLGRNMLIGLIGVFLLLSFQFRSYAEPVIVMTAIPMALIGAILGHLAQGLELSMPSMIGLASLAGVVVNDSILLVMFIKQRRLEGMSAPDAARRAARERFRPILLTSLTTIMGLGPLLLETSLQAQAMIPLATSLAFGLTSATVLALVLVPVVYVILDDLGVARRVRHDDVSSVGRDPVPS